MRGALWLGAGALLAMVVASPALAGGKADSSWNEIWTSDSSYRDFAYALFEPTEEGGSLMLTGLAADRSEVLKLARHTTETFVWVRSGKERWLIRDAAAVA